MLSVCFDSSQADQDKFNYLSYTRHSIESASLGVIIGTFHEINSYSALYFHVYIGCKIEIYFGISQRP